MTSKDTKSGLTAPKKQERLFPAKKKTMQIRMYEDEYAGLGERADAHGVTISQYVRALISNDTEGKLFEEDAKTLASRKQARNDANTMSCDVNVMRLHNDFESLRVELSRQGNNLNQIVRVLNKQNNFRALDEQTIDDAKREAQTTHVYVSNAVSQVQKWIDELPSVITIEGDA